MSDTQTPDTPSVIDAQGDWWTLPGAEPAPAVCTYDPLTREFFTLIHADPSPLEPGVWLVPASAAIIEPPERTEGFAPVLSADGSTWNQVQDLRGQTAYNKTTAQPVEVTDLGPLADGFTFLVPVTPIDTWQADGWAPEPEAFKAHNALRKAWLAGYASQQIGTLQRAVELDMATEAEQQALDDWKRYSILLNRVDTDAPGLAADAWPLVPDTVGAAAWLAAQGFDASY